MDPQATLMRALRALVQLECDHTDKESRDEAVEALEALSAWLRKGGFAPSPRLALFALENEGPP